MNPISVYKMYEAKPVCGLIVAFALNDLRRNVFWSTANTKCKLVFIEANFRNTKVCDFDMTLLIQQNIFRFEIPVNYIPSMQILKRQQYFSSIKFSNMLLEFFLFPEQVKQFPLQLYKKLLQA